MESTENKLWALKSYGTGEFNHDDYEYKTQTLEPLKANEIRVRVVYASCDPTQMLWSRVDAYMPKIELGDTVRAAGVGVVVASKNRKFAVGDRVSGLLNFQQYWQGNPLGEGAFVQKVPPYLSMDSLICVFNFIGITAAYIWEIGQIKAGETVVVGGAAGAVGSLVCQIAKNEGCRVVGIAGTDEKCDWVKNELQAADVMINYKTCGDLKTALKEACPDGIDVYWENIGGELTSAAFPLLNLNGRIVACGMISNYTKFTQEDAELKSTALPLYTMDIVNKRLKIQGFICFDMGPDKINAYMRKMGTMVMQKKLKFRMDMVDGIENSIKGLEGIFTGANMGKRVVKYSEPVDPVPMWKYTLLMPFY